MRRYERGDRYIIEGGDHDGHIAEVERIEYKNSRSTVQTIHSLCDCGARWEWDNTEPFRSN